MSGSTGALQLVANTVLGDLPSALPGPLPAGTTPPAGVALAAHTPSWHDAAVAGASGAATTMTYNTQHDLASVTKIVATTASLMRLTSERLVGLDDPVRRFVPAFDGVRKDDVTVRDLLLHRGGLWEWHPLYLALASRQRSGGTEPSPESSRAAALQLAAELPLRYPPKTARHYSDLGFLLLGEVVAVASGLPLDAAVRELVTDPLGMSHTQFAQPQGDDVATSAFGDRAEHEMVDSGVPYPVPYRSREFGGWRHEPIVGEVNDGNAFHALGGVSGHAGLFSTIGDLMRFGTAMAGYEEHDRLWHPQVAEAFFAPGPDADQSLGFRRYPVQLDGERVTLLGHPGFVGCAVGFVAGRGVAVAMASNRLLTPGVPVPTEQLWRAVLDAVAEATGGQRENDFNTTTGSDE